jgi:beta-mannosidase
MERDFVVPENAEDYVYMSQLLQAYGITKGIEAQRMAKPYNMGTLFWQLNDCWPAVSWSSIDYFGNWKALHYKVKRSFENVLIASKIENNILKSILVNDALDAINEDIVIHILDFDGNIIFEKPMPINVSRHASELINELDLSKLNTPIEELVVVYTLNTSKYLSFLAKPKNLKLKISAIRSEISKTDFGFQIRLSSTTLEKDVFLFCNDTGIFSDNYFDLLPNEVKIIDFKTDVKTLDSLKIKTFNSFIR